MESITIKVEDSLAIEISRAMSPYYTTKTEFIRDAIRQKLVEAKKEQALEELSKCFGSAKTKTTKKQERAIRKKVGKEFAEKFGIKLD
ncbi:MAG: hypothetical protein V1659_01070 [Candidatus Woesearchaeota archaeon]